MILKYILIVVLILSLYSLCNTIQPILQPPPTWHLLRGTVPCHSKQCHMLCSCHPAHISIQELPYFSVVVGLIYFTIQLETLIYVSNFSTTLGTQYILDE